MNPGLRTPAGHRRQLPQHRRRARQHLLAGQPVGRLAERVGEVEQRRRGRRCVRRLVGRRPPGRSAAGPGRGRRVQQRLGSVAAARRSRPPPGPPPAPTAAAAADPVAGEPRRSSSAVASSVTPITRPLSASNVDQLAHGAAQHRIGVPAFPLRPSGYCATRPGVTSTLRATCGCGGHGGRSGRRPSLVRQAAAAAGSPPPRLRLRPVFCGGGTRKAAIASARPGPDPPPVAAASARLRRALRGDLGRRSASGGQR